MDVLPHDPDCPIPAFEDQLVDPNKGKTFDTKHDYLQQRVYNQLVGAGGTTTTTVAATRTNVRASNKERAGGSNTTPVQPKKVQKVPPRLSVQQKFRSQTATLRREEDPSAFISGDRKVYRIRFNRNRIGRRRWHMAVA